MILIRLHPCFEDNARACAVLPLMKPDYVQVHVAAIAQRKLCVSNFPHDPLIGVNFTEACVIKIPSPFTISDSTAEANVATLGITFSLFHRFCSLMEAGAHSSTHRAKKQWALLLNMYFWEAALLYLESTDQIKCYGRFYISKVLTCDKSSPCSCTRSSIMFMKHTLWKICSSKFPVTVKKHGWNAGLTDVCVSALRWIAIGC